LFYSEAPSGLAAQPADGDDDPALSILHLDMDSFYVSVEVQRDPALAGRPVVVGGTGPRGVVASASYEARAHGIRSAMPTSRARRMCPDAVFVRGDHASYGEVSAQLHEIMGSVTPVIEPIALDEAFLDVGAARQLFGSGRAVAWQLRRCIDEELGLPCSVGVARKKLFAKLASEDAKPTAHRDGPVPGVGVRIISANEELTFLHRLAIRSLWGVGPRTHEKLSGLGIKTVGDLSKLPKHSLASALGPALGQHLFDLAHGIDERPVEQARAVKSISHEETFPTDLSVRRDIDDVVVRLSDAVAARLRSQGLKARTVQLKLRFGDFSTISRAVTPGFGLDTGTHLARVVKGLLDSVVLADANALARGVRLIGIGSTGLEQEVDSQLQLQLETYQDSAVTRDLADWESVSVTIDDIRTRFGREAIGPSPAMGKRGPGHDLWGPGSDSSGD